MVRLLSQSKGARWAALAIVSVTMFCGYFFTDIMAPLKPLLESELGWTSDDYGLFTSAYGWFNIFLLMLILGGIILDRMGVRFTGIGAAGVMLLGASIKWWAIQHNFPADATIFGINAQVLVASLGFAIFGVGIEVAGITVSKIIVKWFKGKEMALAMGLQVGVARIGTALAMAAPLPLAKFFGVISAPLLVCVIALCIGFISFLVYGVMDKKLDNELNAESGKKESEFRLSDIGSILKNKGFWLIALLCLLFYSGVFPFLKYAVDLMINKFHVEKELAGSIPSILPIGTLILTPVFGALYDRIGKGASMMVWGAMLLTLIHVCFALPFVNHWIIAVILMVLLGIAFSLVPSAMWPSVPKIIPERQLGTAYSLIFYIQNWGLSGVPYLIGKILNAYCITGTNAEGAKTYDYTLPMIVFASFSALSVFIALAVRAENRKKGYGLEKPNISKTSE